ncbi:unnamed protein product [Brugia pahangi]|uniref:Uncharacterized protein n=1 Tax=Brugia pahangi TaxID=6280 RepID=A0A0N4TH84_BRUPA|nr:unnamed protein product [Brugia pahangi]
MNSLANDMNTSNQLSSFNTKHETKRPNKAIKRKKNPGATNSPEKQYKRAFIWEMEDVCVLSNFFLRSNDPIRNERLAEMINNNVNRLITSIFGIDQDDVSISKLFLLLLFFFCNYYFFLFYFLILIDLIRSVFFYFNF